MDDCEKAEEIVDVFLADTRKQEAYWDSLGVPWSRVITDTDGKSRIQPTKRASLQAAGFPGLKHNRDTDYIALRREVPADQPALLYTKAGLCRPG